MFLRIALSGGFLANVIASPVSTRAACDVAALQAATDSYIAAQIAGDASKLSSVTAATNYTENFKSADLAKGILSEALAVAHNHTLYDTTVCSAYVELIITDAKHPSVTGTQMYFADGGSGIAKVETLVTDKGDWLFDVAGTLKWASQEKWDEIPEAQRDSRAAIQAAADAYADVFNNKSVVVPWGQPCARLEGGSVRTETCVLMTRIPTLFKAASLSREEELTICMTSTRAKVRPLTAAMSAFPAASRIRTAAMSLTRPREASTCS